MIRSSSDQTAQDDIHLTCTVFSNNMFQFKKADSSGMRGPISLIKFRKEIKGNISRLKVELPCLAVTGCLLNTPLCFCGFILYSCRMFYMFSFRWAVLLWMDIVWIVVSMKASR